MPDERLGETIDGRYLLEEVAADELAGRVYLARDLSRNRRVRLKILHREHLRADDGERFRRFQREIEAFSRVRSPGLLTLVDAGTHQGLPYAVFPGIPERTLQDLANEGPVDPRRATELVAKVVVGVAALHRDGIIHRDLVASNVLVDEQGEVHVRDLGLASFVSVDDATDSLTEGDHRVGHAASMAPEYIASRTIHPAVDLYAVGVLGYQLLTGRPPFPGRAGDVLKQHVNVTPPPPSSIAPQVPRWVDKVVLALLDKDPKRRPAPDVLIGRIHKGWAEVEEVASEPVDPKRVARLVVGASAVVLVMGGAGLLIGWLAWLSGYGRDQGLTAGAGVSDDLGTLSEQLTEVWVVPQPLGPAQLYRTRAEATAAAPGVRTGLLDVRSNRRVLVVLDDQPLGYTPLQAWVPVGPHALASALPARPDTRQERKVVVAEATPQAIVLAF